MRNKEGEKEAFDKALDAWEAFEQTPECKAHQEAEKIWNDLMNVYQRAYGWLRPRGDEPELEQRIVAAHKAMTEAKEKLDQTPQYKAYEAARNEMNG